MMIHSLTAFTTLIRRLMIVKWDYLHEVAWIMYQAETIDQFVDRQIKIGRYSSRDELIEAALRFYRDHEDELDHLTEMMREGVEAYKRGDRGFPLSLEEIKKGAAAREANTE